jgi:glutathione synthase/RimK-type ligase-like ATP-grasp enzyme
MDSFLLDMEDFPEILAGTVRLNGNFEIEIRSDDRIIDFNKITSVWWRRPSMCRVPISNNAFNLDWIQNECQHFLEGAMWSHQCLWVNNPMSNRLASRKIVQLKHAAKLGLKVPQTLITNNPVIAQDFISKSRGQVIFKRLGTGHGPFTMTTLVTQENIGRLETIKYSPTIFQEYIEPYLDLRIIWIADNLFSVSINSKSGEAPVDSRLDSSVSFEKYDLPKSIENMLKSLMKNLELMYGAIDMRIGVDGNYYFLEVNPSGQFIYLELKTGIPLAENLSNLLATGLK